MQAEKRKERTSVVIHREQPEGPGFVMFGRNLVVVMMNVLLFVDVGKFSGINKRLPTAFLDANRVLSIRTPTTDEMERSFAPIGTVPTRKSGS